MANTYSQLTTCVSHVASIRDILQDQANEASSEPTGNIEGANAADDKISGKVAPTASEVSKLSDKYALGSLLINKTLTDAIAKLVGKDAKAAANVAGLKTADPKKDKEKSGSGGEGIKNVVSSMLGGVGSLIKLAGALILFAAAGTLFMVIDWGRALFGMAMFALFISAAISLGNKLADKKQQDAITALGATSFLLSASLILFTVALALMSLVMLLIIPGFFGIMTITFFFIAFMFMGLFISNKFAKDSIGGLGRAARDLSLGLIFFAIALVLLDKIGMLAIQSIPKALPILLVFLLFIGIGMMISRGGGEKSLKDLAWGSILLSAALVLFTLAVIAVKWLYDNFLTTPAALIGPVLIMAIFLAFTFIASKIDSKKLAQFALASLLLTFALVIFTLALLIVGFVYVLLISESLGPILQF
jgi:hypothetical protein